MKREYYKLLLCLLLFVSTEAVAQHVVGVNAGYGMATGRFEPTQETKPIWGTTSFGFSWRYYSPQRIVGGVGADLEYIERGFSMATNTSRVDEKEDYLYYTRRVNSLMLPLIWQPHAYMVNRHVRLYGEAGVTLSYNLSSDYEMEKLDEAGNKYTEEGDYEFRTVRDNRLGYGLCAGGGVAILIKQYEINFRARYYFGYSDILRNRNKHYDTIEGFTRTPLRSPLDNLTISVGLSYRFNKEGFESWKPRRKREKNREVFEFGK